MELWPVDSRSDQHDQSHTFQKKRKKTAQETRWTHPTLEPGGLGAATLVADGDNLRWDFFRRKEREPPLDTIGKAVKFFPETKPPRRVQPNLSLQKQAEQGAQFLRTYYPDVDITFELIESSLKTDAHDLKDVLVFDPYVGNLLTSTTILNPAKSNEPKTLLAFPMGENGQQLNVSPIKYDKEACRATFVPTSSPAFTFQTPIQQISALSYQIDSPRDKLRPFLAVRTVSSVHLLDLSQPTSGVGNPLQELIRIDPSDMGAQRPMDIALSPFDMVNGLVITGDGGLYNFTAQESRRISMVLDLTEESSSLWRTTWGSDRSTALSASDAAIYLVDLRSRSSIQIYRSPSPDLIISIESPQDHLMCFSTTKEIIWLDDRRPKKPLLSWKHQREFDRTLEVRSFLNGPSRTTFLTSRKNHLITLYDVNRRTCDSSLHSSDPYALTPSSNSERAGAHLLRHPSSTAPMSSFSLFELSDRHGLFHTEIGERKGGERESVSCEWDEGVQKLDDKAKDAKEDVGPHGEREFVRVDLRGAYEHVFRESDQGDSPSANVDRVLEQMAVHPDHNEGMMTLFDAVSLTPEEDETPRARFYRRTPVDSSSDALRNAATALSDNAGWYTNLLPYLLTTCPNLPESSTNWTGDDFARYGVVRHEGDSQRDLEARACQTLALDLTLSKDVFSSRPIKLVAEVDDTADNELSQATQALSISKAEPPPLQYGYLRPNIGDKETTTDDRSELLGVRALLSEWTLGSDPKAYRYADPYSRTTQEASPTPVRQSQTSQPIGTQRSQGPPVVASAIHRPPPVTSFSQSRPLVSSASQTFGEAGPSHSQDVFSRPWGSSQPDAFGPSTQIEAGRYGGRPSHVAVKKKPKRVGGF